MAATGHAPVHLRDHSVEASALCQVVGVRAMTAHHHIVGTKRMAGASGHGLPAPPGLGADVIESGAGQLATQTLRKSFLGKVFPLVSSSTSTRPTFSPRLCQRTLAGIQTPFSPSWQAGPTMPQRRTSPRLSRACWTLRLPRATASSSTASPTWRRHPEAPSHLGLVTFRRQLSSHLGGAHRTPQSAGRCG